jgi:hypothetical protein
LLDSDSDIMTAAYNILVSSIKSKNIDFSLIINSPLELYDLAQKLNSPDSFSYAEVIWMLMIGYSSIAVESHRNYTRQCVVNVMQLVKY